jgi:crotonobetainyl-CoA:carnitine CoA-transferase CaiB-like acyl-CoA transferase
VPLSGVRVIDLTRILAGPFCSMLLADMGAEVIKIEPPGEGDPVRRQGVLVEGLSWYFAQFNRNKKSITLDLHTEEGKAILSRLIARADVLVENYRPGVLARMGFSEEQLRELNPDLVVCGINDPQVLAQEMLLEVEHPGRGPVRMTGFPVKLSATPCRVRLPAPELGADSEAVLRELGLEGEISRLREQRVI